MNARFHKLYARKMAMCVRHARDFTRSILELRAGAPPSTGWTRAREIRELRRLRAASMQDARHYKGLIEGHAVPASDF